jgi:hypothetical protein
MVNEMVNSLEPPTDRNERLGARLQQIDALMNCLDVIMSSKEASLHTKQVITVIGLSRELLEDAGQLSQEI